jgi:carbon monoxide dehydrogenase subunit G
MLVAAAIVVSILAPLAAVRPEAATDPTETTTVREDRGLYIVSATFQVPQTVPAVLAVLTDYEQIPRFMPDVKTSIVRERAPGRVVVEQEAVARMMMFSKRVHLLLDVRISADTVHFRDSSGRSFSHYEGAWRLTQRDDHTVVTYELRARPSFEVPGFLLTRLLKRDAGRMIERLRTEMAAQAHTGE